MTSTTNPDTAFGATYDNGGRLQTATYKSGQFAVTYTYDARDLLTKVTDSLTSAAIDFAYDNDGRLTGITRSNGANTAITWDAASRLTRLQHGALANLQYTYNGAGEVTRLDYTLPLDPAAHLTSGTDSFTYNEASQITTAGYAYDNQGRQTASPGQTYTWDGATRLTSTAGANMTYNGLNDLLTRQTGGATIHYYYNYALNLHRIVAEYNQTTSSWKRFYVLTPGGQLLYLIDAANSNAVPFYHYDKTGNTLFLTDAVGTITDKYAYSPCGKRLAHEGTSDQPFTFVGAWQVRQENTDVLDLYHVRTRWYDARTRAFLSPEPLWPRTDNPHALNPYQYANADPVNFTDVNGEAEVAKKDLWMYSENDGTWQIVDAKVNGNNGTPEKDLRKDYACSKAVGKDLRKFMENDGTWQEVNDVAPKKRVVVDWRVWGAIDADRNTWTPLTSGGSPPPPAAVEKGMGGMEPPGQDLWEHVEGSNSCQKVDIPDKAAAAAATHLGKGTKRQTLADKLMLISDDRKLKEIKLSFDWEGDEGSLDVKPFKLHSQ